MVGQIFVIGITGGSGSGKSTLVEELNSKLFKNKLSIIKHDNYYFDQSKIPLSKIQFVNFDDPSRLDSILLAKHISELKKNKIVNIPIYDFAQHKQLNKTLIIRPSKIIIVEGLFLFNSQKLLDLFDLKLFIEVESDLRLLRRIKRDLNYRDRSIEEILFRYLTQVKPAYNKFVEPSKVHADFILNNNFEIENTLTRTYNIIKSKCTLI